MASLGKRWFRFRPDKGKAVAVNTNVMVSTKGTFYATVPPEHVNFVKNREGVSYYKGKHRWSAETLVKLQECVVEALKESSMRERDEAIIIRYEVVASCRYCRDSDGNIYANDTAPEDAPGSPEWVEALGGSSHWYNSDVNDYSVSLKAQICKKITYSKGTDYEHVEYLPPEEDEIQAAGQLLNSFTNIEMDDDEPREIPYTEEAAAFFYASMMSLCKLSDGIAQFFGNAKKAKKAIESGKAQVLALEGRKT